MKLIFNKKELNEGISKVLRAVSNKTTFPILECILIDATDNYINLYSSDSELFIKRRINGKIEENGVLAIDSKTIYEIIKKMPDNEDIVITKDIKNNCTIKSGKIELKVFGKDDKQFPAFPKYKKEEKIEINEFTFKNVLNQTLFCVATNDINKSLTGECFEINENILKIISLDGFRIAIRKIKLDQELNNKKIIIPGKALQEVSRILEGNADKQVTMYFGDNNICFSFEKTEIVTPLINGEYFDVNRIINDEYSTKIVINKEELYETLDRSLIFSNERKPVILEIKENKLKVNLQSLSGEYKDEIEIKKSGNDLMIGFNTKLLLDSLKVVEEEDINIYFTNSKSPCYITDKAESGKENDYSYMYLVLPTNLLQS